MKAKTYTKILLGAALVPLLWAGVSYAETETPTNTTTSTKTETSQQTTNNTTLKTTSAQEDSNKALTPDQLKDLTERLNKRKAEFKSKLTAVEQQKIQTKCKSSQGVFTSLDARIKGVDTTRTEVYGGLVSRLSILSNRLKNQGADVTALDSQVTTLKTKFDTYTADVAAYRQAVSDLKSMDCAKDPVAFKASLESARTALTKVRADAQDIKKYVTETIKPTLAQIRSQLEGKSTGDDKKTTTNGSN